MKIGSLEHRDTFCRHFMQTYTEFDPDTLPWPELDEAALTRLKSVPFWEEVFYTERRAGAIVAAFTETVTDPGDDREIRHRCRRAPFGRCQRQCRNPLQGFRFRRMHGFLSGLRRLQDRHAVRIPAQGDVPDLRNPDV